MSCNCETCFRLTPALTGVEAIYKRTIEDGAHFWYDQNGDVLDATADAALIAQLEGLATDLTKVDCSLYSQQLDAEIDYEKAILCERTIATGDLTGVKVLAITAIDEAGLPVTSYYTLATGLSYTAPAGTDLVDCGGEVEYDLEPKEMCDNGTTTFLRWFQIQDGALTGTVTDTDLSGAAFTPTGAITFGSCSSANTYQVHPACFRDPSAAGNLPVHGYKRLTVDGTGAITSVEWLAANGTTVLSQVVFVEVPCC